MKTKNLLLIGCLFFSFTLFAENVPIEKARKVALNFYFEKYNHYEGELSLNNLRIVATHTEFEGETPCYYVFHLNTGGFVIVSANDCLTPVLGYSFDQNYVNENQPPNVQYWFGQYKDQVIYARENKIEPEKEIIKKWAYYLTDGINQNYSIKESKEVEPMLTTTWDQGFPYNLYCPFDSASGSYTYTGCQGTALAQIAYYWRWPYHGQGHTSYIPETNPQYGVQIADYENTWYRYNEMVDEPKTANTAIAEYIYHFSACWHTEFSIGTSFVGNIFILNHQLACDSLSYHFKLTPSTLLYSDSMTGGEWKSNILNMLDEARPVFYAGYSQYPDIGHFFVCDGYQDEEYFHFNFGWSGSYDGYYTLDNILSFNSHQFCLSLFQPDTSQFNYPFYASGADTLNALEGSITDGSGPVNNYLNNTQASWLIDPQNEMDSVTNITLKVKNCDIGEGDYLKFYDGADNTATLLAEITGNTIPETIESSGNRVFVEFTSNEKNTASGFYLNYSTNLPVFCSGQNVINDSIIRINDGSGRFYYRNNKTCMWVLQPDGCDSSLTLYFDYFDTEAEYDYLKIFDLETQEVLAEYSGYFEEPPAPVVSPNGSMMLLFCTNKNTRGKGWSAHYGDFTGIENQFAPIDFLISPNPASNSIHISLHSRNPETATVSIYNQMGQKMGGEIPLKATVGNNELSLDISSFKNGVYFLQISVDGEMVTKKFIKY